MKRSLSIYLWGFLLAMLAVLAGFLLVRFGIINRKSSKRIVLVASLLAAAGGVWLADDLKLVLQQTALDMVALFVALVTGFLALFWAGIVAGFRQFSHLHEQDFGESSILSMQFLDSGMDLSPGEPIWKPQTSEKFSAESPLPAGSAPATRDSASGHRTHPAP